MKLWQKVLIGLIVGIFLGLILQEKAVYLKPVGDIFIRLIKMIITPLILLAIVSGISSVPSAKALGRIGIKAVGVYLCTTVFAIGIGLLVGTILQPGRGVILDFSNSVQIPPGAVANFVTALLHIIPEPTAGALPQVAALQTVFVALFIGFTLQAMNKETAQRLGDFFHLLYDLVFQMVHFVVQLSPLAACALTAWVIGSQGMGIIANLAKLVGCAGLAFVVQYFVFGALIAWWTRLPPWPFFKKSFAYQALAFSTSSSKAALPTTIEVCQKRLGISKVSSSFVLPLGASINMDGIAIYISLCAIFFAQALGKTLGFSDYISIILTSTLGSIGGAGIPSGTIVMLPMVLASIGLPIEGIALIAGIDRIVDMMRTTISITGDAAVTLCVDHSEGLLDRDCYLDSTS